MKKILFVILFVFLGAAYPQNEFEWNYPDIGIDTFYLYEAVSKPVNFKRVATFKLGSYIKNGTNYSVRYPLFGKSTYYYCLTAVRNGVESEKSNIITVNLR